MREKTFNFIPITQLEVKKAGSGSFATFNVKGGRVSFSEEYVRDKGLMGKFLMFFFDDKTRAFAWRKVMDQELLTGKAKWPQVQRVGKSAIAFLSRKKGGPIDGMGLDRTKSYKKCAIRTYSQSKLTGDLDYITLK